MKTFSVTLPITGTVCVLVEADDEDDAIEKALCADVTINDLETWETCRQIVEGNVFYGVQNEAGVFLEEDDEDGHQV